MVAETVALVNIEVVRVDDDFVDVVVGQQVIQGCFILDAADKDRQCL